MRRLYKAGSYDDASMPLVDVHKGARYRGVRGGVDFDSETAGVSAVSAECAYAVSVRGDELVASGSVGAGAELPVAWPSGPADEVGEAVGG